MRIERRPRGDGHLEVLLAEALTELTRRYPDFDGEHPLDPRTEFLVALVGDRSAGCGGIRPLDQARCEMKRLFVAPRFRGRGVARALVLALETQAAAQGFRELFLETGVRQPEAIALYQSLGYRLVDSYGGDYQSNPVSRYFAKALAVPSRVNPTPRSQPSRIVG